MNAEIRLSMHHPGVTLEKVKDSSEFVLNCTQQGVEISVLPEE